MTTLAWSDTGHGFRLAIFIMLGVILVFGVAATARTRGALFDDTPGPRLARLEQRLAALDTAIARNDLSRAVYEWRDAYGAALGTRHWEAMAAVGAAALRVDALAGRGPGGRGTFRAEARQAYLLVLFRARTAGSAQGVERAAAAFAGLGDGEMAARARTVLAALR